MKNRQHYNVGLDDDDEANFDDKDTSECDYCRDEVSNCEVSYSSEDEDKEVTYDIESFSRFLIVPWSTIKLFSELAFLCNIAYMIPDIQVRVIQYLILRYFYLCIIIKNTIVKLIVFLFFCYSGKGFEEVFRSTICDIFLRKESGGRCNQIKET